ncbi:MAG: hypothetical protein ACWGQW_25735 [bacterium]
MVKLDTKDYPDFDKKPEWEQNKIRKAIAKRKRQIERRRKNNAVEEDK